MAARITVIPEPRSDVQVVVVKTNPRLPLHVDRSFAGRIVVSSGDWLTWIFGPKSNCRGDEGDRLAPARLWLISGAGADRGAHADGRARRRRRGAAYSSVGAHGLKLKVGWQQWTVANVEDDADIEVAQPASCTPAQPPPWR